MKKNLFTFLLFMMVISVSFAAFVPQENARQVAKNFLYEQTGTPLKDIRITSVSSEQENGTTICYIFGVNDKGFVIVSADDASHPVIGYSLTHSYVPEDIPAHFDSWLKHYKDQIQLGIDTRLVADASTRSTWDRLLTNDPSLLEAPEATTDVAPLITSMWNQDFPWNSMCPEDNCGGSFNNHVPVGCVATAMTQIMHYWRHPSTGSGQHCIFPQPSQYGPQCANFGNTTYYWNGMTNSPNKECDPVAELSWHGGIAVDMDYDCDGSGSQTTKVPIALRTYFKYSNSALYAQKSYYSTNDWNTLLRNNLDAGQPLEYSGYDNTGGHAWVCDGYQGTDYFHMNWGWGGYGNGYYYLNNLNPPGYNFSQGQAAIVHIQPDASYPTGCSGTTVLDQWSFGSLEDGSGPIADYLNNQNCSWLIMPDDSIENITLSFVRFNTATGDEVKVYDGNSASAPLLATFSGTSVPSPVTSTGTVMFVTFTSNSSGTAPGWLAEFHANTISFCGGTTILTDPTGDISDGSGRFSYRNSSNCKWKIQPPDAASVTLSFDSFDSEEDNDKLQVYDLGQGSLLTVISGEYTTPPPPVTAPSGQMMLVFTTNKTIRGEGFVASYSITTGKDESGSLQGFSVYPNPADDHLMVRFTSPVSQQVTFEIFSMAGSVVFTKTVQADRHVVDHQLQIPGLAAGIYVLRVTGETGVSTARIVIE